MEFAVVVEGDGGTNDKSIWEVQISTRVADATEILLSLATVKNVMVSMNEDSWHWAGEVPTGQVGRREVPGQVTYAATRNIGLVQGSTLKGKFLSDPEFAFTLEAYANDTPAPDILPKESNRVLQSIIDS